MKTDLIKVWVENFNLQITINYWLAVLILILVTVVWLLTSKLTSLFQADVELKIKLGGIGDVKIKPNNEVMQIAHKAWVELKTRKAGLPIDKENDVVADIYKSWYQLFGEIRELTREIPVSKLKNESTAKLVDLLVTSLNEGLRPHLTRWQAKYCRWYEKAVNDSEHEKLTPQDIQAKYPQYKELVEDMMTINKQLVQYTDQIKKLVDS